MGEFHHGKDGPHYGPRTPMHGEKSMKALGKFIEDKKLTGHDLDRAKDGLKVGRSVQAYKAEKRKDMK